MGLLAYAGQAILAVFGSLIAAVVLNVAWQLVRFFATRSDLEPPR